MNNNYKLNFGPQHPAAHGVLRLILELDGEVIKKITPHIGLLHRGIEKLCENNIYIKNIGYLDRLDYVSMMCNEHAYVLAIEKLLNISPPIRAQYIRVLFDEITRILNHLLWLGAHALDVGAMALFLYCFREREDLMDCYEAISGGRLHSYYYRPGGVNYDIPQSMPTYKGNYSKNRLKSLNYNRNESFLNFLLSFCNRFTDNINEYEFLLTNNRIWKQRTVGIGIVSSNRAIELGFTGPMLRASGIKWDIRKKKPYSIYNKLNFNIPIGNNGDSYDRYLVRIYEMKESNKIIKQCINWLRNNDGKIISENLNIGYPKKKNIEHSMELLIHFFKYYSEGFTIPEGEVYTSIEHPKGEFGVSIISDGSNKPYRIKFRAPSFVHLSAINELSKGHLLADMVTLIGTIDIVLGDVDK